MCVSLGVGVSFSLRGGIREVREGEKYFQSAKKGPMRVTRLTRERRDFPSVKVDVVVDILLWGLPTLLKVGS